MLQKSTLSFLEDLKNNNNREWFAENRQRYEQAKADVTAFSGEMIRRINKFDPALGNTDPRKTLFRINRDTRFSHNKEPYKTNFGIAFKLNAVRQGEASSYYVHVEPGESMLAIGLYMPSPAALKAVRRFIDDEWNEFSAIISNSGFRKTFGGLERDAKILKRVPAGFSPESPAAEYLRLTNFYVGYPIDDKTLLGTDFPALAAEIFKIARPFNEFLNRALEDI